MMWKEGQDDRNHHLSPNSLEARQKWHAPNICLRLRVQKEWKKWFTSYLSLLSRVQKGIKWREKPRILGGTWKESSTGLHEEDIREFPQLGMSSWAVLMADTSHRRWENRNSFIKTETQESGQICRNFKNKSIASSQGAWHQRPWYEPGGTKVPEEREVMSYLRTAWILCFHQKIKPKRTRESFEKY